MILWSLEYDREVAQYLVSLRESGVELRRAVKTLQKGIPDDARRIQNIPEVWEWLEARHWITFEADIGRHWIYIVDVSEISDVTYSLY